MYVYVAAGGRPRARDMAAPAGLARAQPSLLLLLLLLLVLQLLLLSLLLSAYDYYH